MPLYLAVYHGVFQHALIFLHLYKPTMQVFLLEFRWRCFFKGFRGVSWQTYVVAKIQGRLEFSYLTFINFYSESLFPELKHSGLFLLTALPFDQEEYIYYKTRTDCFSLFSPPNKKEMLRTLAAVTKWMYSKQLYSRLSVCQSQNSDY